jgi:predicted kinase
MVAPLHYPRLLKAPDESFFLFGLRGVGKSTWARKHFATAVRLDLLDERIFQAYLRDPRLFGKEWQAITDHLRSLPAKNKGELPVIPVDERAAEVRAIKVG